jgi:predicted small secreted protein
MKRTILMLVLSALLLSACGGGGDGRDLSTPSSRLVGRWRSKADIATEKYFSEIDPDTGEGTYTEYSPKDGNVFIMKYMIISEAPGGEKLTILYTAPDGTRFPHADLVLQKDGLRARFRDYYIEYIDDKTEFDVSDHGPIPTLVPITEYKVGGSFVSLYDSPTSDVPLYKLNYRELLLPADGASTAYCDTEEEEDFYLLGWCYVYSPRLGINGWIQRAFLEEVD